MSKTKAKQKRKTVGVKSLIIIMQLQTESKLPIY